MLAAKQAVSIDDRARGRLRKHARDHTERTHVVAPSVVNGELLH